MVMTMNYKRNCTNRWGATVPPSQILVDVLGMGEIFTQNPQTLEAATNGFKKK